MSATRARSWCCGRRCVPTWADHPSSVCSIGRGFRMTTDDDASAGSSRHHLRRVDGGRRLAWFTILTSSRGAVTPHTASASLTVTIIPGCARDAFFGGPNRRPSFGVIEKPLYFFKGALVYGHAVSPSLIHVAVYGSMADIRRPVTPRPQSASLSRQHATNATGLGNDRLTGGGMTRPVPPCPKNR